MNTGCTLMSTGTELIILHRRFDSGTHWDSWVKYPFYPGYSAIGQVAALGEGSVGFEVGQRIAVRCGHGSHHIAAIDRCDPVPDELTDVQAVWFALAKIAFMGVHAGRVSLGDSVVIVGAGPIGQMAIRWCAAAGARHIVAVDPLDAKLELAKQAGATHVVNALADNAIEAVREITKGGAEVALEAVGSAKVLENAYAATARGGKTVSIGLPHPSQQLSISAVSLVAEERMLMGSYMGSAVPKRDVPRFIAMYQNGILPVNQLQSKRIQLDDINAAFDDLHHGKEVRQVIVFE